MNEVVREFLLETHENLAQLDLDLVTLEKDPTERETLARTFRTLHTVKGTAAFLGLAKLQAIAHAAENLLSRLRAGEQTFNPEIASALLATVDAIRQILTSIEATEQEGDGDFRGQIELLEALNQSSSRVVSPVAVATATAATPSTAQIPAQVPTAPVIQPAPVSQATPVARVAPAALAPPSPPLQSFVSQSIVGSISQIQGGSAVQPPMGQEPNQENNEPRASAVSDSSIRVDVGLLDQLMNLVGELVLARNQIMQFSASQEDAGFLSTVQRLNVLTTELQAGVMKTRMQPIGNVWTKFPRLVRDMGAACQKQVRLEMEGRETELDKTIIEAIRDPLTHLVRNAIDHGLEMPDVRIAQGKPAEGRVLLHAFHEGGKVIIEIVDDGRGIDPLRVRQKAVDARQITAEQAVRMSDRELQHLIFLPGFSTTDQVTQFSGRGVGMDVVRTNIEKIGGSVEVESTVGRGTTIRMKIPLTLAIIPALTVTTAGDRYAIPQVSLLELVRLEAEQVASEIENVHGVPVYRLRGNLLPLVYLDEQLQVSSTRTEQRELNIVILQADDRQFGLIVDDIHDTEEIVVKPLQKQLKAIGAFSGATIMGDGTVALILDVLGLAQSANIVTGSRERALADRPSSTAERLGDKLNVLIFATLKGGRMALPLSQVARLEEFPRSLIERTGDQMVVQYRDQILPLVAVDKLLNSNRSPKRAAKKRDGKQQSTNTDLVQVVVHVQGANRVGLIVKSIIDITEEVVQARSAPSRPGIQYSAVVQGRVTEFLDLDWVMNAMCASTSSRQMTTWT